MEFLLKFAIFTSFCVLSQCQFPFVFPTFQQFPNQPAYQSPPMSPQPANEQNRNSPNVQRSWQPSYQPVFQPISRQINPHSQQWSQPCQQGSNFGYPHNNYYNPNPCPTQFDNSQQVWNTRTRSTTTIRTTLRPVAAASTGRISSASKISVFQMTQNLTKIFHWSISTLRMWRIQKAFGWNHKVWRPALELRILSRTFNSKMWYYDRLDSWRRQSKTKRIPAHGSDWIFGFWKWNNIQVWWKLDKSTTCFDLCTLRI